MLQNQFGRWVCLWWLQVTMLSEYGGWISVDIWSCMQVTVILSETLQNGWKLTGSELVSAWLMIDVVIIIIIMTVQRFNAVAVQGTFATHILLRLTFSRASNFLGSFPFPIQRVLPLRHPAHSAAFRILTCVCAKSFIRTVCVLCYFAFTTAENSRTKCCVSCLPFLRLQLASINLHS